MVPPPLAASDAALFDSRCCLRSRVGTAERERKRRRCCVALRGLPGHVDAAQNRERYECNLIRIVAGVIQKADKAQPAAAAITHSAAEHTRSAS